MTQTLENMNSFSVLLTRRTWDSETEEERSYEIKELSPNFLTVLLGIFVILFSFLASFLDMVFARKV